MEELKIIELLNSYGVVPRAESMWAKREHS